MQAVITTYEMVVLETPHLMDVEWKCLIIDEAHRLKNLSCKLVECLRSMSLVCLYFLLSFNFSLLLCLQYFFLLLNL